MATTSELRGEADVACDRERTALRLGAQAVERREEPPIDDLTAHEIGVGVARQPPQHERAVEQRERRHPFGAALHGLGERLYLHHGAGHAEQRALHGDFSRAQRVAQREGRLVGAQRGRAPQLRVRLLPVAQRDAPDIHETAPRGRVPVYVDVRAVHRDDHVIDGQGRRGEGAGQRPLDAGGKPRELAARAARLHVERVGGLQLLHGCGQRVELTGALAPHRACGGVQLSGGLGDVERHAPDGRPRGLPAQVGAPSRRPAPCRRCSSPPPRPPSRAL